MEGPADPYRVGALVVAGAAQPDLHRYEYRVGTLIGIMAIGVLAIASLDCERRQRTKVG